VAREERRELGLTALAIRLAVKHSLPAPLEEWRLARDSIHEVVMKYGWNESIGAFVQHLNGSTAMDAANLIMPLVFFIAPSDPKFIGTLERIKRSTSEGGLCLNHLVFRYHISELDPGTEMIGDEGTFNMCTFWLTEALALAGRYDRRYLNEALVLFEDMIGYANHLRLFSEEIDLRGRASGNFPQALSHLALISAAFNLDRVLG
jgi:GH15 family glucan-1,4-alpha-glucosidase